MEQLFEIKAIFKRKQFRDENAENAEPLEDLTGEHFVQKKENGTLTLHPVKASLFSYEETLKVISQIRTRIKKSNTCENHEIVFTFKPII